jgi:hypothetical protein
MNIATEFLAFLRKTMDTPPLLFFLVKGPVPILISQGA